MIENDRQYRMTKAWAERFATSAQQIEAAQTDMDPVLRQAMKEQYESQAKELQRLKSTSVRLGHRSISKKYPTKRRRS